MKKIVTCLLFIIGSQLYAQNLSDSLLLYLPFNNSAVDESGNGDSVKVFDAQLTTDRFYRENSAYYFNGQDSYIQIIPDPNWSNISDFTISLWFKPLGWHLQSYYNVLDGQYIFDGHSSNSYDPYPDFFRPGFNITMNLRTISSDTELFLRNTTFNSISSYDTINVYPEKNDFIGNWHNNVFVRKGDSTFHYLDGKLITKAINDGQSMDMDHNLYLGTAAGNNPYDNPPFNYNFYGKIDDVRIYNKALDSTDVAYLYYGTCGVGRVTYDTISVMDTITTTIYDTIPVMDTLRTVIHDTITVTDTLKIDVSTVINNVDIVNTFKIYPNPTKDMIYIDEGNYSPKLGYKIRISDMNGKFFYESSIDRKIMSIKISDMGTKGIYLIQILDDHSSVIETRKILLE